MVIFCARAPSPTDLDLVPFGARSGLPRGTTDRVSAEETGAVLARTGGNWHRFDGSIDPVAGPPEEAITGGGLPETPRHPERTVTGRCRLAATADRQGCWWLATTRDRPAVPTPFRSYGAPERLDDQRGTLLTEMGDDLIVGIAGRAAFRLRDGASRPAFPDLGQLPNLTGLVAGTDGRTYFGTELRLLVAGDDELTVWVPAPDWRTTA